MAGFALTPEGIIPHEAIAVEETRLEAKQGRKNRRRTKAKK